MGYSPANDDLNTNPQVNPDYDEAKKIEEANQKTKEKFESLKSMLGTTSTSNARYSKKDTEDIIKKMEETNKIYKTMSAHRMNFTEGISEENLGDENSMMFEVQCHNCQLQGVMRMCTCSIPYFKELIIMAFSCEHCLARSAEVKVGGEMSDKATKYTITCNTRDDMDRDLFKSETSEVEIPEIGLEVVSGSLGGVYSTVEGLIEKIQSTLSDDNPFVGDSAPTDQKSGFQIFMDKLQDLKDGKILPFTVIMNDPLSNCFVQNPKYPEPDPLVVCEVYERTFEQNEELGINDMITENYENPHPKLDTVAEEEEDEAPEDNTK